MNVNATVNDELSQGTCRPSVAWYTASRTCFMASSICRLGSLATLSSAVVYGLSAPLPSSASEPGDVEKEMNEPGAPALVLTIASPWPAVWLRAANGLLRPEW